MAPQTTARSVHDDHTEQASRDLENRTLAGIRGALAQLVYLASTRDYNTGQYHHDGLAFRYGQDAAAGALASWHQQIFQKVVLSPLRELCEDVATYIESSDEPEKTLEAWRRLKAYQLLVPAACDPVSASLFGSNLQLALGVLVLRRKAAEDAQSNQGQGGGGGIGPS